MNARELARRVIGEKAILDAAKDLNNESRFDLAKLMEPGERHKIKDAEGNLLGTVQMTDPTGTNKVVDEEAFLAWVQENHPDAVVLLPTVVPAWRAGILAAGADENGEVPDGVARVVGKPTLTVTTSDEAKAIALGLVRREVEA